MNYDLIYSAALNIISSKMKDALSSVLPGDTVSVIVSREGNLYHGESQRTADKSSVMVCSESEALKRMVSNNESEIEAMVVVEILTRRPVYPCETCRMHAISLSTSNAGTFVIKPDRSLIKLCEIDSRVLTDSSMNLRCFVEGNESDVDDDIVSAVCNCDSSKGFISTSFIQCSQFGNIGCITMSEHKEERLQVPVGDVYANTNNYYTGTFQAVGPNEEYRPYNGNSRHLYYNNSIHYSENINRRQFFSDGISSGGGVHNSMQNDNSKKIVISDKEVKERNAASDIYKNNIRKFISGDTPAIVKNDKPDMENFYKKKFDNIMKKSTENNKF